MWLFGSKAKKEEASEEIKTVVSATSTSASASSSSKEKKLPASLVGSLSNLKNSDALEIIFSFLQSDPMMWYNLQRVCKDFYEKCNLLTTEVVEIEEPELQPITTEVGSTTTTTSTTTEVEKKTRQVTLYKFGKNLYITVNPATNISTYKIPSRGGWTPHDKHVVTTWYKIAVDPKTLKVNTGDFTFAKSIGHSGHHTTKDKVPFGACFGCESGNNDDAICSVDLRGTEFAVKSKFVPNGYIPGGTSKFYHRSQLVLVTGGGYCGWNTVSEITMDEESASTGGWYMTLQLVDHSANDTRIVNQYDRDFNRKGAYTGKTLNFYK